MNLIELANRQLSNLFMRFVHDDPCSYADVTLSNLFMRFFIKEITEENINESFQSLYEIQHYRTGLGLGLSTFQSLYEIRLIVVVRDNISAFPISL